ncbi:ashwin [Lampris incognitus]|uniref:ashwin n=1 Tax=Lampris incognitus TaxID=2546036 RepID=UPI0024B5EBA6|nr:ashwin [Lampris incognitus]
MASSAGRDENDKSASNADLLLHPELLSEEFMRIILHEKKIPTREEEHRHQLTQLYLQHVMPLPQRTLPNNRWGKRMEKSRGQRTSSPTSDQNRKRPPIVFDGSSSHHSSLKVKKPEGSTASAAVTDRLKLPPSADLSNPIRRLSGTTASSSSSTNSSISGTHTANLKREADNSGVLKHPEVKKKIQHVTWP